MQKVEQFDLGAVSAYALAVAHGFDGTEEEWAVLQAQAGENAQAAAQSAQDAAEDRERVEALVPEIEAMKTAAIQEIEEKGTETLESIPGDYASVATEVSLLRDEMDGVAHTSIGKNLFDPDAAESGILNSEGSVSQNTDYLTSDFIPVESNTDYFLSLIKPQDGSIVSARYLSILYDGAKTVIAGTFQNVSPTSGLTISTGEDAKFLRVTMWTGYAGALYQVERGSTYTSYEPYSRETEIVAPLGNVPAEQVSGMIEGQANEAIAAYMRDKKVPIVKTAQLFDRNDVLPGYCGKDGYVNSSATSYVHTKKINVTGNAGRTIYFSNDGVAKIPRYVTAYNAAGAVDSSLGLDNSGINATTYTIPEGIASVVVTYTNPEVDAQYAHFQAEYDGVTAYQEYGEFFELDAAAGSTDILSGKKWAVLGDSFTNGATQNTLPEGKYAGMRKVYPYFIGNRTGMEILRYFEGGRTLAYPSDGSFTNSVTCPTAEWYYQNIPEDVDYITIYLGINDGHHASGSSGTDGEDVTGVIPLGAIDDMNTSSYYGAWNVVLAWLLEHRPFAHIGIIVSNGCSSEAYRTAQIAIAKKYGVPFIDLNGDERTPAMIRSMNPDISSVAKSIINRKQAVDYDGSVTGSVNLHPNDAAHEFESHFIEAWLRTL